MSRVRETTELATCTEPPIRRQGQCLYFSRGMLEPLEPILATYRVGPLSETGAIGLQRESLLERVQLVDSGSGAEPTRVAIPNAGLLPVIDFLVDSPAELAPLRLRLSPIDAGEIGDSVQFADFVASNSHGIIAMDMSLSETASSREPPLGNLTEPSCTESTAGPPLTVSTSSSRFGATAPCFKDTLEAIDQRSLLRGGRGLGAQASCSLGTTCATNVDQANVIR